MQILLCTTNSHIRKRWSSALESTYSLSTADSLQHLKEKIASNRFDLILLHKPLVESFETVKSLLSTEQQLKICLLSDVPTNPEGAAALGAGCVGYTNSYATAQRLLMAVSAMTAGLVWVGTSLMEYIVQNISESMAVTETSTVQLNKQLQSLSAREMEIVHLVAKGLSNNDIAAQLEITERTVKAHLSTIYAKSGCKNRLDLALTVREAAEMIPA